MARRDPLQGAWLLSVDGVDGQIYRRWIDFPTLEAQPPQQMTFFGGRKQNLSASPDGEWLAFSSFNDGFYNLFMVPPHGRQLYTLTNRAAWDIMPNWSPNGEWIAFSSDIDSSADLYRLRLSDRTIERLTSDLDSDSMPAWSPDGRSLVFQSSRDNDAELYRLEVGANRIIRLTHSEGYDGQPDWSPDGRWIAFTSLRPKDPDFQIYRMNADGSRQVRLTPQTQTAAVYDPKWSPDGQWIAYWSGHPTQVGLYVMRYDGMQVTLVSSLGTMLAPEWMPLKENRWSGGVVMGLGILLIISGWFFRGRWGLPTSPTGKPPR